MGEGLEAGLPSPPNSRLEPRREWRYLPRFPLVRSLFHPSSRLLLHIFQIYHQLRVGLVLLSFVPRFTRPVIVKNRPSW